MDIGAIVGMATSALPFVDSELKLLLLVTAPFNLLKCFVISLIVFCVIANLIFQGQQLHWNHLAALVCLVLAVYFIFK